MRAIAKRHTNEERGLVKASFDRGLFDPNWGNPLTLPWGLEFPEVNSREDDKSVYVEVKVPEIDRKDIKVEFKNGHLSITGEKSISHEAHRKKYYRSESYERLFSEQLYLGSSTVGSKAKTAYKAGRLTVTIPKKEGSRTQRS